MDGVEVLVSHEERATLRVGEVFLKVDADASRLEREVEAMALAPVPTAEVLWHRPPALALARLHGVPIARLGEPATASSYAWEAAGAMVRGLHDTTPPQWRSPRAGDRRASLDEECAWLVAHEVVPAAVVRRNRELAEAALQPRPEVFVHGDLQVAHVFVEDDRVTGVLDWSEAGRGDPMNDLAVLTLGHPEHLDDVLRGYAGGADRDAVSGWWSLRCLTATRWLVEHGFDPTAPGCEVDVLLSQARS